MNLLKRFRVIKWKFSDMQGIEIIGKKWGISKGQYKGLMFSVYGLGLTKAERSLGREFFEHNGMCNIYLGKLIISYRAEGAYSNFKNVDIISDRPLFT